MGKPKIINKQNLQVNGWLASEKNISKPQLVRGQHLPAICVVNTYLTRVQSLRSDLMAFNSLRQAYTSGYTLFLLYNTSSIQTIPLSTASGKGSRVFITISSFLLVRAFYNYLLICGSKVL